MPRPSCGCAGPQPSSGVSMPRERCAPDRVALQRDPQAAIPPPPRARTSACKCHCSSPSVLWLDIVA
eukprot:1563946-Alexandrium_andersonii.AAC.1